VSKVAERTVVVNMARVIRKGSPQLRVLALAVAAAAFPSIAGAAPTASAPLPNGKYTYAIIDSGKRSGTSTIVVTRSDGALLIEEHASPMESTGVTRRTLDPSTFATRSYAEYTEGQPRLTVTIVGNTASMRNQTPTERIVAPPDSPFVVWDGYVALFFQLPATLHASKTPHLTVATVLFEFKADPLRASIGAARRPQNVPLRDAGITVMIGKDKGTLWYDPQTFALDEFDLPAHRFAFTRLSSTR